MADPELIRQYYNISDQFSEEWSESKAVSNLDLGSAGETSKYALLREIVSSSSAATSDVPQDEPDPLGSTTSVVSVLKARGIDVSDPSKRNRYLISSTSFAPRLFLRDVHPDATYDNLVNSLSYLESTISERSEALRYLVEHDYDRFVQAKSSLDSVFRNIKSAGFNENDPDFGFHRLKSFIDDANAKATILMKPVMDNKAKDERLRTALALVDSNKYLFNLPSLLLNHIKNNDHDSLIRDYRRGKDMRLNEQNAITTAANYPNRAESQQVLERIWNEVEGIVDDYRKQEWKNLAKTSADQNYLSIIAKLLELGVEDNPIYEWISSQNTRFETEFNGIFDKLSTVTQTYRDNIMSFPPNSKSSFISAIRYIADLNSSKNSNSKSGQQSTSGSVTPSAPNASSQSVASGAEPTSKRAIVYDSLGVIEMWLTIRIIFQDMNTLISRFCLFWKKCLELIQGIPQRNLPTGWQNESGVHLTFTDDEINSIRENEQKVISLLAQRTDQFFSEVVSIASDVVKQPKDNRRLSVSQRQSANTEQEVRNLPKFLPPNCNALSCVNYLSKILYSLASGFDELSCNVQSSRATDTLKNVLVHVREVAIEGVLYAWEQDSKLFYLIENWVPCDESHSTKMTHYFYAYQSTILAGVSDIMKFSCEGEVLEGEVIPPVQMSNLTKKIQGCFFNSVSTTLDSFMKLVIPIENDRRKSFQQGPKTSNQIRTTETDEDEYAAFELLPDDMNDEKKTLLTLSSLEYIRDHNLPALFKILDSRMHASSREASQALRSSIDTMTNTLFELYNRRKKTMLAEGLRHGILKSGIKWNSNTPDKPTAVSSYIYECLLSLVVVHSKVTDIAPTQVTRVITVLYDHIVKTLLSCYREIEQFGKYGLLQVIADIGLMRVTMERFQTPDMLQTYSLIYECVKEATIERKKLWESEHPPWEIIHPLVREAQASSNTEFRCFHSTDSSH